MDEQAPRCHHVYFYSGIQNIKSLQLPDGSTVQLGPGSKLIYPSEFEGHEREVQLEGQAFFDVHKDARHPFVVKTKDMKVTALGTAFEMVWLLMYWAWHSPAMLEYEASLSSPIIAAWTDE